MQIWSLQGGVCELTLHGHEAAVSCLQFDETRIISGALDRLIKIWNITNGEVYLTYLHHKFIKIIYVHCVLAVSSYNRLDSI
jgi:WD40 repeat protein